MHVFGGNVLSDYVVINLSIGYYTQCHYKSRDTALSFDASSSLEVFMNTNQELSPLFAREGNIIASNCFFNTEVEMDATTSIRTVRTLVCYDIHDLRLW